MTGPDASARRRAARLPPVCDAYCTMSLEKHASSFDEKAPGRDPDVVKSESVSMAVEERRLVRKIDWRIMPIACIMYLFACEFLCAFTSEKSVH